MLQVGGGVVQLMSYAAKCCACCRGRQQQSAPPVESTTTTPTAHITTQWGELHQPLLASQPRDPSNHTIDSPKTPRAEVDANKLKFLGDAAGCSNISRGAAGSVIGVGSLVRGASGSTEACSISIKGLSGEFDAEVVLQNADNMSSACSSCGSLSAANESGSE